MEKDNRSLAERACEFQEELDYATFRIIEAIAIAKSKKRPRIKYVPKPILTFKP